MLRAVVMIGLLLHRAPSTNALEADRSLTTVEEAGDSIPIVDWATGSHSSSTIAQNIDPQALAAPVASSSDESSGSETSESPAPAQSSVLRSTAYSQSSGQSSSEGSDRSFAPRPTRTPAPTPAPTHTPTRTPTPIPNTIEPVPTSAESPAAQTSSSSSLSGSSVAYDSSPILTPTPVLAPASARTYSPAPATNESDNSSTTTSASGSSTPAPATTTGKPCLASVSVEGMHSNFCIYSVGKICSSTIKGGLCPGPQPGLERGSYCDMIRRDDGGSSNNSEGRVYGCKLTPIPAVASTDTKASEGNHGRGRWVRRQY